mgnify:FL=1
MKLYFAVAMAALTIGCANRVPVVDQPVGTSVERASAGAIQECTKPPYPPAALAAGRQGATVVVFTVALDGNVVDAQVEKSSGHRELDAEVVKAVLKCRVLPKAMEGKAAPFKSRVTYVWKYDVQRR